MNGSVDQGKCLVIILFVVDLLLQLCSFMKLFMSSVPSPNLPAPFHHVIRQLQPG